MIHSTRISNQSNKIGLFRIYVVAVASLSKLLDWTVLEAINIAPPPRHSSISEGLLHQPHHCRMLITETHKDVPTQAGGDMSEHQCSRGCDRTLMPIGIFLFHPTIPNYPKAKFPGVVVFSEIYQGTLYLLSICCHGPSQFGILPSQF
jgi:hypothetical protein